ncbi:UNVERIFIED_CONTAM: hypothetical protein Slati_1682900 [Sesamum latifolium]|uniref:Reverse transcriptase RNase H-like domain-containing protein n=1 Tax=Sesamum latifolium TaxID=2727402 RepID=A0AAW2WVR5_9LAMI
MALALVVMARRLRPYFLSHPVGVKTNMPLKQTLGKSETSGRLIKWAVELSKYDILYLPRTTIKAQALVDFVFEMMGTPSGDAPKDEKWLLHACGWIFYYPRQWCMHSHYFSTRRRSGVCR